MIWLMEGFSSQRTIADGLRRAIRENAWRGAQGQALQVLVSHRQYRPEIDAAADVALREPTETAQKLDFVLTTAERYGVRVIHTGKPSAWFEQQRQAIEAAGVTLITGVRDARFLTLAEDKAAFTAMLASHEIPHTPAVRVDTLDALRHALQTLKADWPRLCIKPNTGIYGLGYWRLDDDAPASLMLSDPDQRRIRTSTYLSALEESGGLKAPMIVMPYLPGPESSIDLVAVRGRVIAALGRRKNGPVQTLFDHGEEIELACRVAEQLEADGLINVQTRADDQGCPRVLECNLRPSGGVGYGLHSGINLPAIMMAGRLGLPLMPQSLRRTTVRIVDEAIPVPASESPHA
ncbi:carbamoyl-phosphate synthase large chain [Chimaeribacter coloradensis]|uniref:Carbamoyl-phosphate synthase large chain n=1 Tax=Chimaeribacter coloradensis TaxID=2060068 RepID=A0A2N5E7Z8_9GAMM|nr:ATP-grasp domain-containing protein [Chimaeribacter coloradensis]PLR37586.1 carbamoyl-phosphate synthase large chain [Chimaeribacter coloradensis]